MTREIRNCNVCVVGGAGFLGSHLVNHLIQDRGCEVTVIDNLAAGRAEFVHPKARLLDTPRDITGPEEWIYTAFKSNNIKFVFNYAALPYVPDSYARPLHVFNVNCFGAIKVINAAQEAGVEAILQVSSAELYGEGSKDEIEGWDFNEIREDAPVQPHSSYGASKAAVDYFCQVAWKERQTPVIALRQFNCVGERETHPYVVTEIISQLFRTGPRIRLGNNASRDFMYAGDAVRIAVELLERGQFGEVYNLGSEESVKVYDLAQAVGDVCGAGRIVVEEDPSRKRPWEIWHLQSDNAKVRAALGGVMLGMTVLKHSLQKTIAYFEANGRKWCWEK